MAQSSSTGTVDGFGLLLRETRRRSGLTQEELAASSGMSDRAIRDLERGRVKRPRHATIELLVSALGLEDAAAQRFRHSARSTPAELPLPSCPVQLPADIAGFTGRTAQLRELTALLASAGRVDAAPVVASISGIGGVGKTTLAVHAAHTVAGHFPDGQLYLDLTGRTAGVKPTEPDAALAVLLRAVGVADRAMPHSVAERAALYRTLLSGRRMLVVLDNAADAAQVRPLLPAAAGCAVLVTARSRLTELDSAAFWDLDVLTTAESVELLAAVVGAGRVAEDPDATGALIDACARLPLAVRIAGARLATRPEWPVRALADRLSDARHRLDELRLGDLAVRATLQVSYRMLPAAEPGGEDSARAFRLLGAVDATEFALSTAAAVLGTDERAAEAALERLVDARMLETPRPGRYRLHDLVGLLARELADQAESPASRAAARERAVRALLAGMQQVGTLERSGRLVPYLDDAGTATTLRLADSDDALAWIEAELPGAVDVGVQASLDPRVPVWPVACLAAHVCGHLEYRGMWERQREFAGAVLTAARRAGDAHAVALAGHEIGLVDQHRGGIESARRWFTDSLATYRRVGDAIGEARALNNLGAIALEDQQSSDDPRESAATGGTAAEYFDQALAVCRAHDLPRGEAGILSNLGLTMYLRGRLASAARYYTEALDRHRTLGNLEGVANTLGNLGSLHRDCGDLAEALACHKESLRICQEHGNRYWAVEALTELAADHRAAGHPELAVPYCEQGLAVARQLGDARGIARALDENGQALRDLGYTTEATACWHEALRALDGRDLDRQLPIRQRLATTLPVT